MSEEVQRQEETEGRLRSGGQRAQVQIFSSSFLSPPFLQGAILTTMLATRNFSGESRGKTSHLVNG